LLPADLGETQADAFAAVLREDAEVLAALGYDAVPADDPPLA
jgi:hypothetical protein